MNRTKQIQRRRENKALITWSARDLAWRKNPNPKDEDIFLADITSDPGEMTNIAGEPQRSQMIRELYQALDQHSATAIEVPHECLIR